jgi:hypothetical protein
MRKLMLMLAAVVLVLVVPAMARANLVLYLADPAASGSAVSITDNGVGDGNSTLGVVSFNGALGGGSVWAVNITTGLSKPVLGDPPRIDLNSVNATSTGAGTLLIELTDTDFMGYSGVRTITSEIGGTANNALAYYTAYDNANSEFGGTLLVSGATFGPGAFSQTFASTVLLDDPFSLTQAVLINHAAGGRSTSFDALLKVPEPGTMTLLGLGFLTLAFRRRRASR